MSEIVDKQQKLVSLNLLVVNQPNIQLTASLAAWLLTLVPEDLWEDSELSMLRDGVVAACKHFKELTTERSVAKCDPRFEKDGQTLANRTPPITIYTDYDLILSTGVPAFLKLVDSVSEADFIYTVKNVSNFLSLPLNQRICQFPYEAGLIRKDLLPLTVRRECFTDGVAPFWWLPCFDLKTEFHLFSEYCREHNDAFSWIIKPAQGTRGHGHQICINDRTAGEKAVRLAALSSPLLPDIRAGFHMKHPLHSSSQFDYKVKFDGTDRVAQQLVNKPLLLKGRKFDLRLYVFVRSFVPFEAYCHKIFYARLANKEYCVEQILDREVALTVSAYDDDATIAGKQDRIFYTDLAAELSRQYPQLNYSNMIKAVYKLLQDLFRGVSPSIGMWPNSSAYYSVDVIFDASEDLSTSTILDDLRSIPTYGLPDHFGDRPEEQDTGKNYVPAPKLVEVNFMGDWRGLTSSTMTDAFEEWKEDLFTVLATDIVPNQKRLHKL